MGQVNGHRLLDLSNNVTVDVLGHGDARISDALIAFVDMVQFSCSASESILSAVRPARAFTGRTKIAKFEGGYHGFTDPVSVSAHPETMQRTVRTLTRAQSRGVREFPMPLSMTSSS